CHSRVPFSARTVMNTFPGSPFFASLCSDGNFSVALLPSRPTTTSVLLRKTGLPSFSNFSSPEMRSASRLGPLQHDLRSLAVVDQRAVRRLVEELRLVERNLDHAPAAPGHRRERHEI